MPASDDELKDMARDLYKRLGGIGSKDARIVAALLDRWEESRTPPLEWIPRDAGDCTEVPEAGWYWIQFRGFLSVAWKDKGDNTPWRIAGPIPEPREPEGGRDE